MNFAVSDEFSIIIAPFIIFKRGKINSLIDYGLKESIFNKDNDLFLTGSNK
jgi:hypothetical protein